VVAPLSILRFMIDHPIDHLNFACREVALEIGGIVPSIPQAELDRRIDREVSRLITVVGEANFPNLEVLTQGYEIANLGFDLSV
jgi:hypothetical protein